MCVCALACKYVQSVYPTNELNTYTMTRIPFVVGRYLKRVAHESFGLHSHSRRHHPRSGPGQDHMLLYDSDTSEVHSGHMQPMPHLFLKQSSLPHDVEPDARKKMGTSTFSRQMSEDGSRYRKRPKSRPAMEFDSDSSLSSSNSDRRPVVITVSPSSRSRGIPRKSQSRKLPNVLSLLSAQEASMYVCCECSLCCSDSSV